MKKVSKFMLQFTEQQVKVRLMTRNSLIKALKDDEHTRKIMDFLDTFEKEDKARLMTSESLVKKLEDRNFMDKLLKLKESLHPDDFRIWFCTDQLITRVFDDENFLLHMLFYLAHGIPRWILQHSAIPLLDLHELYAFINEKMAETSPENDYFRKTWTCGMTRQLLSDCKDKQIKIKDGPYMAEVIKIYDARCKESRITENVAIGLRQDQEASIETYKPLAEYLSSHWAKHGLINLTTDGKIPRICTSKGPKVDGDPNHCFLSDMPAFPSGPLVSKKRKRYRKGEERNSLNSSSGSSSSSTSRPCIDTIGEQHQTFSDCTPTCALVANQSSMGNIDKRPGRCIHSQGKG